MYRDANAAGLVGAVLVFTGSTAVVCSTQKKKKFLPSFNRVCCSKCSGVTSHAVVQYNSPRVSRPMTTQVEGRKNTGLASRNRCDGPTADSPGRPRLRASRAPCNSGDQQELPAPPISTTMSRASRDRLAAATCGVRRKAQRTHSRSARHLPLFVLVACLVRLGQYPPDANSLPGAPS